jgi:peptidoglycan hydrolase CwlO-like protein
MYFTDIEAEYQAFLVKREETEKSYQDTQAELDGLMREVESFNNQLTVILADEGVANELVKTLPEEIKLLEVKIESASKLLFSES